MLKMDGVSLSNFRGTSNDSSTPTPGDAHTDSVSMRSEANVHTDSVSMRSDANVSLSSLEELATGLMRRVARRKGVLDRQASESGEDAGSERVRFDDNVSFIEAEVGTHCKVARKHSSNSADNPTASTSSSR